MVLATRKGYELLLKLDSLRQEFDYWRDQSREGGNLEKHHRQIERIITQMARCEELIHQELKTINPPKEHDPLSTDYSEVERTILEAHRIWDFFRSKLVQRQNGFFRPYLTAADEFAWSCYGPAIETGTQPASLRKEPPLIFLNGGVSPFAMPRSFAFRAEIVPGEDLMTPEMISILRALPIPTAGVPWFQASHLPDVICLGHEVGHLVAADCGLEQQLPGLLAAANLPASRLAAWQAWADEIFADLYGTLAAGPAFVSSLMDFLAASPTEICRDHQPDVNAEWRRYPTSYLRILLCLHLLAEMEAKWKQANEQEGEEVPREYRRPIDRGERADLLPLLTKTWKDAYSTHAMPAFEADIPHVVATLLGPFPELGDKQLWDILCFTPADHQLAEDDVSRAFNGQEMQQTTAVSLLTTTRLAYDRNPQGYIGSGIHDLTLTRIQKYRVAGIRAERREQLPNEAAEQKRHDINSGDRIFATLRRARPETSSASGSTNREPDSALPEHG